LSSSAYFLKIAIIKELTSTGKRFSVNSFIILKIEALIDRLASSPNTSCRILVLALLLVSRVLE